MMPFHGNVPDQIWSRLKEWAKAQAAAPVPPTYDECVAQVQRIVADVTGSTENFRREVVTFYASEAAEMVLKFRQCNGPAGTTGLQAAI